MADSSLPDDIWLCLFQYLDACDMCVLSQVCKQLHELSNSSHVWKNLCDEDYHLTSKEKGKSWKEYYSKQGLGHYPQPFRYFVCIYVKCTVDVSPTEIIEFNSVCINTYSYSIQVANEFHRFCKPSINPKLTTNCVRLNKIRQTQIDKDGILLSQCLSEFHDWISSICDEKSFCFVSIGNFDLSVLDSQCENEELEKRPYFDYFINLKMIFKDCYGYKPKGLDDMQDRLGLGLSDNNSKGIHKARDLAAVCKTIIKDGYILKPNRYKNE